MVSIDASRVWNRSPRRGKGADRAQAFFPRKRTTLFRFAIIFFFGQKIIFANLFKLYHHLFMSVCLSLLFIVCLQSVSTVHCSARTLQIFAFFFLFFFIWNPLFIVSSLGWFFLVKVFPLMNNYFLILAFFFLIISLRKVPLWAQTCLNRSWVKSYTKLVIPLC